MVSSVSKTNYRRIKPRQKVPDFVRTRSVPHRDRSDPERCDDRKAVRLGLEEWEEEAPANHTEDTSP